MISVLYVDDEPDLLELATIFLTQSGDMEITSATSAPDALALLSGRRFDAIVADYQMPDMDGIEFLITVRASFGDIPFILFTGRGREEVVIRAIEHGADAYLQKGGDPRPQFTELAHKIRQVVRRNRAEDSLRESEKRFRGMAERSSDLILILDEEMKVTYASPSIRTITGYDPEDLLGRSPDLFVAGGNLARVWKYAARSGRDIVPEVFETEIRKKDQSKAVLEVTGTPVSSEGGIHSIQIQARDITARKQAEERLKEAYDRISAAEEELKGQLDEIVAIQNTVKISEEKFRNVIDHSPLGMHFFEARDGELVLVGSNPAADAILGINHERLIGKTIEAAFPGLALTAMPERFFAIAMDGSSWHTEDIHHQAGTIQRALAVWGFQATPGTMVSMFMDITDRRKAEEQIRDNDRFLQDIFSSIQDGICILDKDMTIVKVNDTMEKWYAHSMPLIGKKCYAAYHLRTSRCDTCPTFRSLHTSRAAIERIPRTGPTGEEVGWLELYSFPLIDSQSGRMNGVIEYARDISEQVRTERELEHRLAVENLISGISNRFINIDRNDFSREIVCVLESIGMTFHFDHVEIILCSEDVSRVTDVYGWHAAGVPSRKDEIVGMDVRPLRWVLPRLGRGDVVSFSSPEDLPEEAAEERRLWERFGVKALAGIPLLHDNHLFGFLGFISTRTSRTWPDEDLNVLKILGILFTDVFMARRSRKLLLESEAKYRELVESAASIIIRMDREANLTFFNEYAEMFFGFTKEELIGKPVVGTIVPKIETGGRDLEVMIRGLLKDPEPYTHNENENLRKNGERVWVSWTNKPIFDENGLFTGLLSIGTDINERRKAERALQQANEKLNLMNSITRHDILNKLTVVRGYIELMDATVTDAKISGYLSKEKEAVRTIEEQIAFTRIYQDLGVHGPRWQKVGTSVQKAAKQIDLQPVTVNCMVGGLELYADPLLERVFYNLADNAIRYGKTLTEIGVRSEERDGSLVLIWEDNGIGIPASDKEAIFTRGFGKNTGLGLFLVREILSITGMTITETGVPGKGTRFEIAVPAGAYRFSHR